MVEHSYGAVIVGAGHNGLMSGEVTRPGFVHDLYAANQNLFLGSPVYAGLGEDLQRHGLPFKTFCAPSGASFPAA